MSATENLNPASQTMRAIEAMLENAAREDQRRQAEAVKFRRELAIWKAEQATKAAADLPHKKKAKRRPKVDNWHKRLSLEDRRLIIALRKKGQPYKIIADLVGRPEETCRMVFSVWRRGRHADNARRRKAAA